MGIGILIVWSIMQIRFLSNFAKDFGVNSLILLSLENVGEALSLNIGKLFLRDLALFQDFSSYLRQFALFLVLHFIEMDELQKMNQKSQ